MHGGHHEAGHHEVGPGHQLERLVFFSDAVFAIAITLLIIEIHPPHLRPSASFAEQASALSLLLPQFAAFLTSFFVIGAFWAGHHRAFSMAGHWDERLIRPNLLLLLAVVAMPFFTAFMSTNAFARLPVMLYCAWLLGAGLLNIALQHAVFAKLVVAERADWGRIGTVRRRGIAVALGAACALLACAVLPVPGVGMLFLTSMPLWRILLDRRARRISASPPTGEAPPAR